MKRVCVVTFIYCLFSLNDSGQAQDSTPQFKAHIVLVTVPVVVSHKGKSDRALVQGDFEVEQDGKRVDLSEFEFISVKSEVGDTSMPQSHHSAENTLTRERYQSFTIIAIDALNTGYFAEANGKHALLQSLRENLVIGQPTALLLLNRNGVQVISDVTTDVSVLLKAVQTIQAELNDVTVHGDTTGNTEDIRDPLEKAGGQPRSGEDSIAVPMPVPNMATILSQMIASIRAEEKMKRLEQIESTRITLNSLETVAKAAARLPGRKALLWLTGSFPFPHDARRYSFTGLSDKYERVLQQLNNASISVYPIHVRGLTVDSPEADVGISKYDRAARLNTDAWYQRASTLQDTAIDMAAKTGGLPFINTNDFVSAVHKAIQDSRSYYMLGYYLPKAGRAPGWHRIKVRLKTARASIRYRTGFIVDGQASSQAH